MCIALLTDFGLADPYVGQLRAVLAGLAPRAVVIDLSHGVRPFDVRQAGLFAWASAPWLPRGAVLLAVVDPGVGSARRLAVLEWRGRWLLGPDNGLFSLFLDEVGQAWDVTPAVPPVSATFHGRDVLAPLAARLAQGEAPATLGRHMDLSALRRAAWTWASIQEVLMDVTVLHVDHFGNCQLNLPAEALVGVMAPGRRLLLRVQGLEPTLVTAVNHFAELSEGDVGLLAGSQGVLELAVDQGSAAVRLGLAPGEVLSLEPEA